MPSKPRPRCDTKGNPVQFISHKELAAAFVISTRQLTKELEKISERAKLKREKYQVLYSPAELQKIFSQLGNPFS